MINFKIFTLFPEMFDGYLKTSVLGRGFEKGLWNYKLINIRDYSKEKHKKVDDTPFGGGSGMVMNAEVIANAIDNNCISGTKFYYMSPRGKLFNQKKVREIVQLEDVAIICGHYEGVDQRVIEEYNIEEISLGDFVLTGGELPAMCIIDACVRCIDGVLGNNESIIDESFGGLGGTCFDNLLEYPLYTKPQNWRNRTVPEVLISGNHKKIEEWRLKKAEEITKERRLDLWNEYIKSNKKQ